MEMDGFGGAIGDGCGFGGVGVAMAGECGFGFRVDAVTEGERGFEGMGVV